jgi:hypothetical protein
MSNDLVEGLVLGVVAAGILAWIASTFAFHSGTFQEFGSERGPSLQATQSPAESCLHVFRSILSLVLIVCSGVFVAVLVQTVLFDASQYNVDFTWLLVVVGMILALGLLASPQLPAAALIALLLFEGGLLAYYMMATSAYHY